MMWNRLFSSSATVLRLVLALATTFIFQEGFAQSEVTAPSATSITKKKNLKNPDDLTANIGFDLTQESYSTPSVIDNGSAQKIQLDISVSRKGSFFTNSELILGSYSNPNSFYFALPEAYVGWGDKYSSITFGKKIENLSFADSFFNFGLVQPFSTQDNVDYIKGGLTSLGAHYYDGSIGFNLAYNPMFIPNQGPQVKIDDGKVINATRWAQTPPSQFKFGDERRDIVYALREYKLSDIVANSGYTANFIAGQNPEKPTLSLTYGQIPINELALSRDTYSDIATFKGNVILNPVVLSHEIYAADLSLAYDNFRSTFSFLGDHPVNKTAPGLETMQTLSALTITTAHFALDLSNTFGKKMEVYLAVADVTGGEIRDLNSSGQSGTFNFASSRTQFRKPVIVGVNGEMFFIYNRPFEADIKFTRDQEYKGSMLSAKFKYSPIRNMNVHVGADIIGVDEEGDPAQMNTNFFDQNKANDRFTAGVGYVF